MRSALVLLAALIAGCSGYSQFYTAAPGATPDLIAKIRANPPPALPEVEHAGGNPQDILSPYLRRGYGLIGYSSYSAGGRQSDSGAVDQAKKVGADIVVIISPTYAGSVTSSMPITTPTTSTSYTTGTATAYGSGGSATAYGNSTTTTYGTHTQYVPYTIQRFNYGALYLVKRTFALGVNARPLTDQERAKLQSNKGVFVTSVVDGSPAFREDVLVGDILTAIDGETISGMDEFSSLISAKRGQLVNVTLVRNGSSITKRIQLTP
ncbi:MAG TPA: PDZ domain-containing protein [Steroidobacteraceae bacterium]|nr:PDZ domain-containing protein [Steroidobacteraceae bacterium]